MKECLFAKNCRTIIIEVSKHWPEEWLGVIEIGSYWEKKSEKERNPGEGKRKIGHLSWGFVWCVSRTAQARSQKIQIASFLSSLLTLSLFLFLSLSLYFPLSLSLSFFWWFLYPFFTCHLQLNISTSCLFCNIHNTYLQAKLLVYKLAIHTNLLINTHVTYKGTTRWTSLPYFRIYFLLPKTLISSSVHPLILMLSD